jgi:putative DNA methylase
MKRKLIEVALPLEAINKEAAREKSIRHGHPSTLHLWWARRPLAACRAVLFASLVDDPSSHPDKFPTEEAQSKERKRLFDLIEELVKWENINNDKVMNAARAEILKSTDGNPPPVLDPFAGGGSIPLEAQRLGLEAHASDLNPVAVLINKALIEIPPKFAGRAPINPEYRKTPLKSDSWQGARGLAEDVRYYGKWMRDEAEKRIGHLYPKATLPNGEEATVIAWLWARTVKCPNPACGCQMPLVRSFVLSSKKGKETYVEPVIDRSQKVPTIRFEVKEGKNAPDGTVNRRGATCIACKSPVPLEYVRAEGRAGRMSAQLMAIVAEGERGRAYLSFDQKQLEISQQAAPTFKPDAELPHNPRDFKTPNYGLKTFGDLFTNRQLVALTTFSDLVSEARQKVLQDAQQAGLKEAEGLEAGGNGSRAYADAVGVYLGFVSDKVADYWSSMCSWHSSGEKMRNTFGRQAIPMVWDYAEANPFCSSSGNWIAMVDWVWKALETTPANNKNLGLAAQRNATDTHSLGDGLLISTDPPYYDNIGYADLSDFFYVWMRRSLSPVYPSLFSTMLVPKAQELVATPYRFGGSREKAQSFFEKGLGKAFERMYEVAHPDFPVTVYYAFKQSESEENDEDESTSVASTGWETMLNGLIDSGFQINGTWPMRSELSNRMVGQGTNALASSIVLVCRPRPTTATTATRRKFLAALRRELPQALRELQQGFIAPVDLAQAAIGPGMAVFSRYKQVLESDGSVMPVRTALSIINQMLDEVLAEQEGDFDADTRWALAWFSQYGMNENSYGEAETLSKAKNTSVQGMVDAGILYARAGRVRLLRRDELPENWNPQSDGDVPIWEATQYLVKVLETQGEEAAADLSVKLGSVADTARELAYRLYRICELKGWTQDALSYNALVTSWIEVSKLTQRIVPVQQGTMF